MSQGKNRRNPSAVQLMILLAVVSLVIHFWTGWIAAVEDAEMHGQSVTMGEYFVEWVRDTFENLQSEFWQLAVQFALLGGFLKVIGVTAYEEDQEAIKSRLDRMALDIEEVRGK